MIYARNRKIRRTVREQMGNTNARPEFFSTEIRDGRTPVRVLRDVESSETCTSLRDESLGRLKNRILRYDGGRRGRKTEPMGGGRSACRDITTTFRNIPFV